MSSSAIDLSVLEGVPGKADFKVGEETFKTWYSVCGDLKSGITPLIVVSGGPGCSYHYVSNYTDVYRSHQIPVILYDQLGTYNSSDPAWHLHDRGELFFTPQLFMDELENLVSHLGISSCYDLTGHSWGGMLCAQLAAQRQPKGLRRLIISNSFAATHIYVGVAAKLVNELPPDVRDTLKKHEADGTTDSPEYHKAAGVFYAKHLCRIRPLPELVQTTTKIRIADPYVYNLMWGPSEFTSDGTLKDWNILDDIHKINVPTLLINGEYDENQDECMSPFFERIPKVKWAKLMDASHCSHWEQRERYMTIVGDFLRQPE